MSPEDNCHEAAARHYELAAQHHRAAAERAAGGDHDIAAQLTHLAHRHAARACRFALHATVREREARANARAEIDDD